MLISADQNLWGREKYWFNSCMLLFFYILYNNNNNNSMQSIGCPSDFCWLCPLEFCQYLLVISSGLASGLLLVHWKSVRKVCWTERSSQKCPDKQQKLTRKLLQLHNSKIWILATQSLTESSWSPLGKAVAL